MLYIIGTGHHYQFGAGAQFGQNHCTESDESAFVAMLRGLFSSVAAEAFAEELSLDALAEIGETRSVIQVLASELSALHVFCDPDRRERIALGIRDENEIKISSFPMVLDEEYVKMLAAESWRRREQEWLHRLASLKSRKVVFVCGANHIGTFVPLALERGYECTVVHENWYA